MPGSLPASSRQENLQFPDGRTNESAGGPAAGEGFEIQRVSSRRETTVKEEAEPCAASSQIVAGLAHQSRNAMQRIQACLEMLTLEVHDRPEAIDLIGRIQAAQDHLSHLYEEAREYVAPIVLKCERARLDHVIREAWRHVESCWSGRTVRFDCFSEYAAVDLDCLAMDRVFRNVFENSLAASRDPVEIDVRSGLSALNGRAAVEIVIRDNGPGLTPQQQLHIFEPFYTTKTRGTGLGMAMSRRLIEAHGGQIAARSAPTGGTEIVVTLPKR